MFATTRPDLPERPNGAAAANPLAPGRRVTDAPTRAFHWLFALSFVGAYLTADGERWRLVHVVLGYTMAGLLGWRVLYGLVGPRHVRLAALARKLAAAPGWARATLQALRTGDWNALAGAGRQGQNLALAGVIAALLLAVPPLVASGVATFHDWGGEWLEEVHEFFGNGMLALVLAHLGLLAALSVWRRQNLARPMLTGRTPGRGPDLVTRNHGALALLLVLAVLAYWAWEWSNAPTRTAPGGTATSGWTLAAPGASAKGRHHDDEDEDD